MINDFSWPKLDVIVILHDICNVREVEMIEFCMVPTMFEKSKWYNFAWYLQCSRSRNVIILHGICSCNVRDGRIFHFTSYLQLSVLRNLVVNNNSMYAVSGGSKLQRKSGEVLITEQSLNLKHSPVSFANE